MRRGRRGFALTGIAVVAVGAIAALGLGLTGGLQPTASPLASDGARIPLGEVALNPGSGDPALLARVPRVQLATTRNFAMVHTEPGGPEIVDAEGSRASLETGRLVAIIGDPVLRDGLRWRRVYVLPNANTGPNDYLGWLSEKTPNGADQLDIRAPLPCPPDAGILALGALDQFTRARCLGVDSFTLRGWTWERNFRAWYDIEPAWLGTQNGPGDSTIALWAESRHPAGANGSGPFPFVEAQLPPGLAVPPLEFQIEAVAHVADERAAGCHRNVGLISVPPDDPAFAAVWCATRLVIEGWSILLGPEERPIDPLSPQLHRHPEGGPDVGCRGVGMAPLVFRVDPTQPDPVWLELADQPGGHRFIPSFDPDFRTAYRPNLVVLDETGRTVVADGTPLDPDGQLAGHFVCPTGRVIYFD